MTNHISTSDTYESCFYLLAGCSLVAVEGFPRNGRITCSLKFTGTNILSKQAEYFSGKAVVDLFEFRRTYQQVCAWIKEAKKEVNRQLTLKAGGKS